LYLRVEHVGEERGIGCHGSHVSRRQTKRGLIGRQFGGEIVEPPGFAIVIGGEIVGFGHI
jgi:hypothetical protein